MSATDSRAQYDVIICGGGLAGLSLARQLAMCLPEQRVVVIDKLARPLPEAAFKVGESTFLPGGVYLGGVLNLTDYLERNHFPKFGLRYYFGGELPFASRPELGRSTYDTARAPGFLQWQLDRGVLENDMREMNAQMGVHLLEGWSVDDIELSDEGAPHTVVCKSTAGGESRRLTGRWVVDAMSRRRYLQKKLELTKPISDSMSAVWFRVEGRIDIESTVPPDNQTWHSRWPGKHPTHPEYNSRYFSTNHLMGDGYWVWTIPLRSGYTSIGIVADERTHPFDDYNKYDKAIAWLQAREPHLAKLLDGKQPLDFKIMRKYSYSSTQVLSAQRWACVGEAGVFIDPFYSPGSDSIGYVNCVLSEIIMRDTEGKPIDEVCALANEHFLRYAETYTAGIHSGYSYFGNGGLYTLKWFWDLSWLVAWGGPLLMESVYKYRFWECFSNPEVRRLIDEIHALYAAGNRLLTDWSKREALSRASFQSVDYLSPPFFRDLALPNTPYRRLPKLLERLLGKDKKRTYPGAPFQISYHHGDGEYVPVELILGRIRANLEDFETFAQALFLTAVEDVMPDQLAALEGKGWLNAWAIGLDSARWQSDGLFAPKTQRPTRKIGEGMWQLAAFRHMPLPLRALVITLLKRTSAQPGDVSAVRRQIRDMLHLAPTQPMAAQSQAAA